MPKNVPIYPQLQDAVTEVLHFTEAFLGDLVARTGQTKKGRVLLKLLSVKQNHGKTRREALRELDRVVTELFPPVEGAPLPSEELNGKADVLKVSPAGLLSGASAVYYCLPVDMSRAILTDSTVIPYGSTAYVDGFPAIAKPLKTPKL